MKNSGKSVTKTIFTFFEKVVSEENLSLKLDTISSCLGLSNEVLTILVDQGDAKLTKVKVGGLKIIMSHSGGPGWSPGFFRTSNFDLW